MTRLFTSDLESASFATEGLVASGGIAFATDRAHVSTRSLKVTGSGQYATRAFSGVSGRDYFARVYVQLDTLPPSGVQGVLEWASADGAWMNLAITGTGAVFGEASDVGAMGPSAPMLTVDTWHRVEMRIRVNTAANDEFEVRFDGATMFGGTQFGAWTSTNLSALDFGNHAGGDAVAWYDNFALNDNQGASDNSWPNLFPPAPTSKAGSDAAAASDVKSALARQSTRADSAAASEASSLAAPGTVTKSSSDSAAVSEASSKQVFAPAELALARWSARVAAGEFGRGEPVTFQALRYPSANGRIKGLPGINLQAELALASGYVTFSHPHAVEWLDASPQMLRTG